MVVSGTTNPLVLLLADFSTIFADTQSLNVLALILRLFWGLGVKNFDGGMAGTSPSITLYISASLSCRRRSWRLGRCRSCSIAVAQPGSLVR